MEPFLDRLAALLLERHGNDLAEVAVVLPGRRAGLHLRKYLAHRAGQPLWSPDLLDPGAFLERIAGWRQGTSAELLLLLHACHAEQAGQAAEPLAAFLQWAPTTLRDISEADAHLLDLDLLYRDLRDYHELEEWGRLFGEVPSPSQQRLLGQWAATGQLHRRFAERMRQQGVATSGAIAREAARIAADPAWAPPWKAVWIAGLNALEPAASAVLNALSERGLLHAAWDADRFYLDDPQHEAGRFLRRSIGRHGQGLVPPRNAILEHERRIALTILPDRMAMARYAAAWASELPPDQRGQAAIVLADEGLLLPLLEALPEAIGPVNVSMGLPLATLPVHGLIEEFLRVLASPPDRWRTAELTSLLGHPLLRDGPAEAASAALRARGWPVWQRHEALAVLREAGLHATALAALGGAADAGHCVEQLIAWALLARPGDDLAREQLFQAAQLERALRMALQRHGQAPRSLAEHALIRQRLLGEARLTLFGEPLRGLQVLGLLETRAIDFRHVLILGATEGILAGRDEAQSWIPYALRRRYGLPLLADGEALGSYHVHRLLHAAETLTLAHAPAPDGSGTPVRFIAQWRHELEGRSRTTLGQRTYALPVPSPAHSDAQAAKTEPVLASLRRMAERGFSPSALGAWLWCPLDFHIRHVLGVRPPPEASADLGDDVLGIAAHRALERLYDPWRGQRLTPGMLSDAAARAEEAVMDALAERLPRRVLGTGAYLLRGGMAGQAIRIALEAEAERARRSIIEPIAVERVMEAELRSGIRILGKADRLERRDGILTITDIKTGGAKAATLAIGALDRAAIGPESGQALQLLMYAAMALRGDPALDAVQARILPLRKPSAADDTWLTVAGERAITRAMLPALEALILALIDEVLDPAQPFAHRAASERCACCVP